jgi:hypothetical protein
MYRTAKVALARVGFSVLVIGGLLFGAQTAWGSSAERSECLWHPPTFLGACTDQQQCQQMCYQYNSEYPWVLGECNDGCCSCVI